MAGHLYIRNITTAQLGDLYDAGGKMVDTIFHYDRDWAATNGVLAVQEAAAVQSRHGLPAHCYMNFVRNNTSQAALTGINATLGALTKPAGIIAAHQGLAGWPGANAGNVLWTALQQASVTIEFYQFDGNEVRVAVPWNSHRALNGIYFKRLTEGLVEVFD